jgi:hypothetical protein
MKTAPPSTKSDRPLGLSAVEAAHFDDCVRGWGLEPPLDWLRQNIKSIAYHEAGHVAARMFTGHEAAHFVLVSIIPEGDSLGRERSERNIAEIALARYPEPIKEKTGRCLLLSLLAGEAAQSRINGGELGDLEHEMRWRDSETWEQEGTDFFRAARIAEIIGRPGVPAQRVFCLAARWADEMFSAPEVWAAVERLAALLIERGEITDREEVFEIFGNVADLASRLPRWRRRLFAC